MYLPPPTFPIHCTNCHDEQLKCKASPHKKGHVISALHIADSVFSNPLIFSGMNLITVIHLHFSATAYIAHKVTVKKNSAPALLYSAHAVVNLTFHVYSYYHIKAAETI